MKKLLLLIVAALLAWHLGPVLSLLIWFIPFEQIAALVVPDDIGERSAISWVQFAIWAIVFWFLVPKILALASFAAPNAQRYSETKIYRRAQGATAELMVAGLLFGAWMTALVWMPAQRDGVAQKWGLVVYRLQEPALRAEREKEVLACESSVKTAVANWNQAAAAYDKRAAEFDTAEKELAGKIRRQAYVLGELSEIADGSWTPLSPPKKVKTKEERSRELTAEQAALDKRIKELQEFTGNRESALQFVRLKQTATHLTLQQKEAELNDTRASLAALEPGGEHQRGLVQLAAEAYQNASFWGRAQLVLAWDRRGLMILFLVSYALLLVFRRRAADRLTRLARIIEQGRFGLGGSSRFAGLIEEWAVSFWHQSESLFVGRSLFNPLLDIGLEDKRHMLTIAGSRSGKGASAIIPNLLLWKGSALVIDPKGTNAAVTARHRRGLNEEAHVVDPFDVLGGGECASFNPLSVLDPNSPTIREEISVIADALVISDPQQRERHWDDGARSIIAGLIGHLVSSPAYVEPSLPMIRDLLTMLPEQQAELWADMSLNLGAGGLARDAAARVIRGIKTNEILGILSNADKHTEWLSSPAIQRAIGKTTFRFSDLKDKPTTVFLVLPPHLLETHNRFLRLMVNMAMAQMSMGGRSRIPVLMLLDEFLALGRMTEIEKAFGLMAGYNLTIWPFVQDFGRLKDLYGSSVNAFITNSRAVQVFGVFDEETTTFVSKTLGNRAISSMWGTLDERRRGVPLRDPSEVARDIEAESGRQYILRAGRAPLVLERVPYYTPTLRDTIRHGLPLLGMLLVRPQFQGKFDPDPDYV